jgi:hypothetical protein
MKSAKSTKRAVRIRGCSARPAKNRCVYNTSGVFDKECRVVEGKCVYDPDYKPVAQPQVLKKNTGFVPVMRPEGIPLLKGCKYTIREKTKKLNARNYCKSTLEGTIDEKCEISSKKRCIRKKK